MAATRFTPKDGVGDLIERAESPHFQALLTVRPI